MALSFSEAALAVLFLLQETGIPLTMEQISNGLSEASEYTYLDAAIAVNDMMDKGFIEKEIQPLSETYAVTIEGRINLAHLPDQIRGSVRHNLAKFAKEHLAELSLESNVYARTMRREDGTWQVIPRAYDKDMAMSELVLTAQDGAEARKLTENWTKYAGETVAAIYGVLNRD